MTLVHRSRLTDLESDLAKSRERIAELEGKGAEYHQGVGAKRDGQPHEWNSCCEFREAFSDIKDFEVFVGAADAIRKHSGFEYGDGLVEAMVYYDRARGSKNAIEYKTGSIELEDYDGNRNY